MAIRVGGEAVAALTEDSVDLIVCRKKSLGMPCRFELTEDFLSFAGRPVRSFDTIVQAFMRSVIRFGSQHLYGLDVTAQFVCYDDTWLAITRYEAFQKAFLRPWHYGVSGRECPVHRRSHQRRAKASISRR